MGREDLEDKGSFRRDEVGDDFKIPPVLGIVKQSVSIDSLNTDLAMSMWLSWPRWGTKLMQGAAASTCCIALAMVSLSWDPRLESSL